MTQAKFKNKTRGEGNDLDTLRIGPRDSWLEKIVLSLQFG